MKTFLDILQEEKSGEVHHVFTFGRMNPPTTGHLKLIDKVKDVAKKNNATHSVITSHSQDAKKNPLSASQKLKHLKRYSPGTNFEASSKANPSFIHQAEQLHKKGVTHLHMVVGSDRVAEMKEKLNKYNGTHEGALYNFKKITIHSAGERDPDAEGTEGMSGTKMREHAKNNDIKSFKLGVPNHVSNSHAKELMHDTRTGMGLNESHMRGKFKAIFVTGGPGSGKDIIIREAIAEQKAVELNIAQAFDYLMDKQKLSEQTRDYRREAIRIRGPLIINSTADNIEKLSIVKEELEELGYSTMMVYVDTLDEVSRKRNIGLRRMIDESIRQEKWQKSQTNKVIYHQMFEDFNLFNNNDNLEVVEESITDVYDHVNDFLDRQTSNDVAYDWLAKNSKIDINEKFSMIFKEYSHVSKNSKSIQKTNSNSSGIKGQYVADNNSPVMQLLRKSGKIDSVTDGDLASNSGYTFRTYESNKTKKETSRSTKEPKLTINPPPKEPNFTQDKEKLKAKNRRWSDSPTPNQRLRNLSGIGPEFDTRQQGTVYPMSGLGDVTYREDMSFDKYNKKGTADGPRKFSQIRSKVKEAIDDPGAVDMGVGGVLNGATNKEPLQSYKDQDRTIGITIKKKKKQEK